MKKSIAALALSAILIPAAVFAGSHYGNKTEHRIERMSEQLQLSEQQRAQVQQIFEQQHEKKLALRAETHERISQVLTPEQQAQWQQYRKDRKQRACDHHGKGERRGAGQS